MNPNRLAPILLSLFLVVCIAVHVLGLIYHPTQESNLSHIAHLVSYSLCLLCCLRPLPYANWIYVTATVYPFVYHGICAYESLTKLGKPNWICFLVIILLPLGLTVVKRINGKS